MWTTRNLAASNPTSAGEFICSIISQADVAQDRHQKSIFCGKIGNFPKKYLRNRAHRQPVQAKFGWYLRKLIFFSTHRLSISNSLTNRLFRCERVVQAVRCWACVVQLLASHFRYSVSDNPRQQPGVKRPYHNTWLFFCAWPMP